MAYRNGLHNAQSIMTRCRNVQVALCNIGDSVPLHIVATRSGRPSFAANPRMPAARETRSLSGVHHEQKQPRPMRKMQPRSSNIACGCTMSGRPSPSHFRSFTPSGRGSASPAGVATRARFLGTWLKCVPQTCFGNTLTPKMQHPPLKQL